MALLYRSPVLLLNTVSFLSYDHSFVSSPLPNGGNTKVFPGFSRSLIIGLKHFISLLTAHLTFTISGQSSRFFFSLFLLEFLLAVWSSPREDILKVMVFVHQPYLCSLSHFTPYFIVSHIAKYMALMYASSLPVLRQTTAHCCSP